MNSCCSPPIEQITEDKHKQENTCCPATEKTAAPARVECPVSKTSSKKVHRRTVEHLLKPEAKQLLQDVQYYYCSESTCEVVYFSYKQTPYFTTNDMKVKIFSKNQGDDVNVCYCFDWSRGRIRQQIYETGKSTAALEIAQKVKEGLCKCDIKNPKGGCCLNDVKALVKQLIKNNNINKR